MVLGAFTKSKLLSPGDSERLTLTLPLRDMASYDQADTHAYARDPVGFGNALREAVRHLCKAKMQTKAFLHPERTYDDSFFGSLDTPAEWNFTFPYSISLLRYLLNNLTNVVVFAFRFIL